MRIAVLAVACACSVPRSTHEPAVQQSEPRITATSWLATAAHARWTGDLETAATLLAGNRDPESLAELGRIELARQHPAAAQRAFEEAVAIAEARAGKGTWHWRGYARDRVAHLAFTSDGRWLVGADPDGRVEIWDVASMRSVRSFSLGGYTRSFELAPNGRWLATLGERVKVWDLQTGAEIADLPKANVVAFTRTNTLLVAGDKNGFAEVEIPAGTELRRVEHRKLNAIMTSGEAVVVVDTANQVHVIDSAGKSRKIPIDGFNSLQATDNGLVASTDGGLIWYDLDGEKRKEAPGRFYALAVGPDGLVATTNYHGKLSVYDANGELVYQLPQMHNSSAFAFHPRGRLLVVGSPESTSLLDARTGKHLAHVMRPMISATSLAFDARGETLVVGSGAGHIALWSMSSGAVTTRLVRPNDPVYFLAIRDDGEIAAASTQIHYPMRSQANTLVVWDADGKKRWWTELERLHFLGYRPKEGTLSTVQMMSTGDSRRMVLALWDRNGNHQRAVDQAALRAFHWTLDGKAFMGSTNYTLVTTSLDAKVKTSSLVHTHSALSEKGFATATDDGRITIWDAARDEPTRVLFDDNGSLAALAWMPDGTLVSASHQTATIWDVATGNRLATLVGDMPIMSLAVRPDGLVIATGHHDGRVVLWATATGKPIATLHAPSELATYVTTPDGAIDGTIDEEVLAWAVGDMVLPARGVVERQRVRGLLAARLANVPREASPRIARGAAPLPACYFEREGVQRQLRSASIAEDGKHAKVCVDSQFTVRSNVQLRPPATCFSVDLATGKYKPYEATAREVLGLVKPGTRGEHDAGVVSVCKDGNCTELRVRELDSANGIDVTVDDNARYAVVAYTLGDANRDAVLVYEVESGKRLSQFIANGLGRRYEFVDQTLLVTTTCDDDNTCPGSTLYDPRTGRAISTLGVHAAPETPAKLGTDLWAFHDWSTPKVVVQNVKTGRIASRFKLPARACNTQNDVCSNMTLLAAGQNIAVLPSVRPGDVMVLDQKGTILGDYSLPLCQ